MAGLDNQSFIGDDCLSLGSSSEKHSSLSNNDDTLTYNLIGMDVSDFNKASACLRKIEIYEKLQSLQSQINQELTNIELLFFQNSSESSLIADLSEQEKSEVDSRSIYVGNVDYSATAVELQEHFLNCGLINRVTILCNKYDGHPKGFAFIEFADKDSVNLAMRMNNSLLRGRQLKVNPKRTNKPGMSTTNRPIFRRSTYQENTFYGNYRSSYKIRVPYFKRERFNPY